MKFNESTQQIMVHGVFSKFKKFEKEKICWGNLCQESPFTLDIEKSYINAPACILTSSDKYVLGCLNSRLLWWFLKNIAAERRGGFIEAKPMYVSKIPIYVPDFLTEMKGVFSPVDQ
jgi:hypothetical protein